MDNLAASPPPPLRFPLPPEELVVEILVRLPPEPIYLLRASLVCKRWRRLIHDPRFIRRHRALHAAAPPVVGFFTNQIRGPPAFVLTSESFAAPPPLTGDPASWLVLDSRHGRVLLFSTNICSYPEQLLVWDPITGDKHYLRTPRLFEQGECNGAVLCAPGHDCHSTPFLVAFVYTNDDDDLEPTSACVYSSVTGNWGEDITVTFPAPYFRSKRAAHVGNSVYFEFNGNDILEFDFEGEDLNHIKGPYGSYIYKKQVLMPAEDGGLGVAALEGFILHLWSRAAEYDGDVAKWTLCKIIDLEQFIPPNVVSEIHTSDTIPEAIGYSEDADEIFICIDYNGVYTIHAKSMRFKQVLNKKSFEIIYPYSSFYIPGANVGGGDCPAEQLMLAHFAR